MKIEIKDILIIILIVIIIYIKLPFDKIKKRYNKWKYQIKKLNINAKLDLISRKKKEVDKYLKKTLEQEIKNEKMKTLFNYALEGGKRIRSIILISIYQQLNQCKKLPEYVINAMICIEYLHCASLIIDDIMDEDIERRGKECFHIKYGITMAQLIAIQLVSLAFQKICTSMQLINKEKRVNKDITLIILTNISENINELSIGQYLDINLPKNISEIGNAIKDTIKNKKIKLDIEYLIHKKTSSLFKISFIWPWILTYYYYSNKKIIKGIKQIGQIANDFGMIFQIADDFEDVDRDLQRDGKNTVINYVIHYGYDQARCQYYNLINRFIDSSIKYNIYTPEIKQIINYLNKKVEIYYRYYKYKKN